MSIVCPYCQHPMKVKAAKPGKYTPKCGRCSRPFQITVPDDPNNTMFVAPLPSGPREEAPAAPQAQSPIAVPAGPDETAPFLAQPPADNPDATAPLGPVPAAAAPALDATVAGDTVGVSAAAPAPAAEAKPRPQAVPETLGGYRILKELGRGGMGAVYLARQLSLDRNVALKVMNPKWAADPAFLARFTREAYAAAQLVHHNVVQIYDIGADHGINYFSMEFVEGQSLGEILKKQGKLDVPTAVGYTLQAARGLKFGHDHGMVHRDVKPDNLMLNTQGVVKVADLGLVKTPGMTAATDRGAGQPTSGPRPGSLAALAFSQVTLAGSTMGTPAYMAPEQARDASHVDARADVYSLGCTLYFLVTGRPPFQGATALEVLTKHAHEPVLPPDALVKEVPKALSDVILKMVAKKPEERHPDLGAVMKDLENVLGAHGPGRFAPGEEHAATLEESGKRFNSAPTAVLRSRLALGFFAGCGLTFVVFLLLGWWKLALGFAGLAVLTPLAYLLLTGFTQKTYLFLKARELLLGNSLIDWLVMAAGGLLILGLLYVLGLFWLLVGVCVMAALLAAGLHFYFDRRVDAERRPAVEKVEQMLRGLRLRGLGEDELREFVCKYSGDRWEEFYEALFGYDAKLDARSRWGQGTTGRPREKHAAWRDPVFRWIEARQRARREAKAHKHLQAVEQKKLQAEGMDAAQAQAKAEQAAEAMVHQAAQLKKQAARGATLTAQPTVAQEQPGTLPSAGSLLELADRPETLPAKKKQAGCLLGGLFGLVFGPKVRFLVGAVLLAGCVAWMHQNGLIPGQEIKDQAAEAVGKSDVKGLTELVTAWFSKPTQPLSVPLVPEAVTDLFASFNPGVAGLILIASALVRGFKMALFVWPAAALVFAGHLFVTGIPDVGVPAHLLTMAAGAVLALIGFVLGRSPT